MLATLYLSCLSLTAVTIYVDVIEQWARGEVGEDNLTPMGGGGVGVLQVSSCGGGRRTFLGSDIFNCGIFF